MQISEAPKIVSPALSIKIESLEIIQKRKEVQDNFRTSLFEWLSVERAGEPVSFQVISNKFSETNKKDLLAYLNDFVAESPPILLRKEL